MDQYMGEFWNIDEASMTKAEITAHEARLAVHMDVMDELAERVFKIPAHTWGDRSAAS